MRFQGVGPVRTFIARLRRNHAQRKERMNMPPSITPEQWQMYVNNLHYRAKRVHKRLEVK